MTLKQKVAMALAYSEEFKTVNKAAAAIGYKSNDAFYARLEDLDLNDVQWSKLAEYLGVKIKFTKAYTGPGEAPKTEVFLEFPDGTYI